MRLERQQIEAIRGAITREGIKLDDILRHDDINFSGPGGVGLTFKGDYGIFFRFNQKILAPGLLGFVYQSWPSIAQGGFSQGQALNFNHLIGYISDWLQRVVDEVQYDNVLENKNPAEPNAPGNERQEVASVQDAPKEEAVSKSDRDRNSIRSEVMVSEISTGIEKFRVNFPKGKRTAFIMMQFRDTKPHKEIVACVRATLATHGVTGLRADDKEYMSDLFPNIKTYMHCCDFGVAIFERIESEDFNPNVSLEVGYMLGLGKEVLLLKDGTLKALHTDLAGKLYRPFNTTEISGTMPEKIENWLRDKGLN